jgi:hypothetical protein
VRTVVRSLAQALAPLLFGGIADLVAGITPSQAPIGTHPHAPAPATGHGLSAAFLILLGTLAAAGVFLLRARFTYPRDVATAAASHQGTQPGDRDAEPPQGTQSLRPIGMAPPPIDTDLINPEG